jgi:hypothetical protein
MAAERSKLARAMQLTVRAIIGALLAAILGGLALLISCTSMPGTSHEGESPAIVDTELATHDALRAHVEMLATTIGPRNDEHPDAYLAAQSYIEAQLGTYGYTDITRQPVETPNGTWHNIEVVIPGVTTPEEIVLFAAHYDSCHDTPGADDNASGVAGLLEMARLLKASKPAHTIKLVFLANEEPPHFKTATMGSVVYARAAKARSDDIRMMYSLEMIGYFDDEPGSQHYPALLSSFYPDRGNFIAFVSTMTYRKETREAVAHMREVAKLPIEGFAGPASTPGIDFSDHWSFWQAGYPAILVTDTSFFRTPHYHEPTDTAETLDYVRLAHLTLALVDLSQQ